MDIIGGHYSDEHTWQWFPATVWERPQTTLALSMHPWGRPEVPERLSTNESWGVGAKYSASAALGRCQSEAVRGLSPTCQPWWCLIIRTPSTDFRPCPVPLPANATFQINHLHTNTLSQGCSGENKSNASWAEDWWQSWSHLIPSSASSPNTKQILEYLLCPKCENRGLRI